METLIIFLILAACVVMLSGRYLFYLLNEPRTQSRGIGSNVERVILKSFSAPTEPMTWKQYFWVLFSMNMVLSIVGFIIILLTSGSLMSVDQAFNTIVSFMTNTNLQHYAGETQLSLYSQMFVIITFMFVSSASGIAVGFAFIRGLTGKPFGNFYKDIVKILIRFLIPVSFVIAILLVWQGVPQTLQTQMEVTTITGRHQIINLGPVAALEAIKHLGTNGGGFFGASSAIPYENPNLVTNIINMLAMITIPGGLLVAFGLSARKHGDKKSWLESTPLIIVSMIFFLVAFLTITYAEYQGSPVLADLGLINTGNLEGKELRFGILNSSIFTTVSSSFTTGSVNSMHDSLTAMGGLVPMFLMMLNIVFGGSGVGFMNLMMYVFLTVFICGLMIGRTPSYFGKKIESQEMKRVAMVIIIHPLLILGFTAIALKVLGLTGISNHNYSQILYEFTSASANNGSGFEGLQDNTLFWNVSTALVMFIARYVTMYLQLSVVGLLYKKQTMNDSIGTLRTNTGIFTIALLVIIILISALTFFPALILGPITESLL